MSIAHIQGSVHRSPLEGSRVKAAGVVTAVDTRGVWLQDPVDDNSPATSQALYLATTAAPGLRPGDRVEATGRVDEHRPGGVESADLSSTRVSAGARDVRVVERGVALPDPVVLGRGGRTVPAAITRPGDVDGRTALDVAGDALDFFESLEGMRVTTRDAVVLGPSAAGTVTVLADGGSGVADRSPRGGMTAGDGDPNPERIVLADTLTPGSVPAALDTGDTLTPATGILDYDAGAWCLLLTQAPQVTPGHLQRQRATAPAPGALSIATANVENLSAVSPAGKFEDLAREFVTGLRSPDIVIAEEIQDNDGDSTDTDVVAADTTWRRLTDAISRAGGPAYQVRQIDPVDDADGGARGGNIRVGIMFRTDRGLTFTDRPGGDPIAPTRVLGAGGATRLSASPGRITPGNPAFAGTRKSLAAEFRHCGETLFVLANHWSSQRGDSPATGRYQPPRNPSRETRLEQARAIASFTRALLAANPAARLAVTGDLNDTEYSTPVRALTDAGLTDLPATLPRPERYTYIHQGNGQILDHILLSPALTHRPHTYEIIHLNSEFHDQASDHDPQLVHITP
ncbi:endonuclease/exonuclease/phosphatase family protein [Streptomyces sp. NPDC127033]|uniref:endonuclease/exonuclease/phosphatase family protein n=1 Tax=Streptomyces sp. NPDC127033 TaxID=3347110 RepID=UPI00365EE3E1